MAKRKYNKKACQSSEQYSKEKKKVDLLEAPKTFTSRTQLKAAHDMMRALQLRQIKSVKAMGFGSILGLQCTKLDRRLCAWLVENFDPVSLCLHVHGKRLVITPLDVKHILGLPSGGGQRVILKGESADIDDLCLRHKVGDGGSISLNYLRGYLMGKEEDDDDFKVSFVLYIMGTILCPTSEYGVNRRFLHALKDLTSVKKLDWSQFVLEFLCDGIKKYKEKRRSVIRGCLLFLMLFYLEHCTPPKYLSECIESRSSPRLSYWNDEKIRMKIRWLQQDRDKVQVIVEHGVSKRHSAMDQGREIGHNQSTEKDKAIRELTCQVKRLRGMLKEALALGALREKCSKRTRFGGMDKKEAPVEEILEEPSMDKKEAPVEEILEEPSMDKKEAPVEEILEEPNVEELVTTKKAKCTKEPLPDDMASSSVKRKNERAKKEKGTSSVKRKNERAKKEKGTKEKPTVDAKPNSHKKWMDALSDWKKLILRYVFDKSLSGRETLCDLGLEYLSRDDYRTLQPNSFVNCSVINAVAWKKTLLQKERCPDGLWPAWYMPTHFANYALNGGKKAVAWAKSYCGTLRHTGELKACERVYIPINDTNEHWFMCVVNLRAQFVCILDSLPSQADTKKRTDQVHRVVTYLNHLLDYLDGQTPHKLYMLQFRRLDWLPVQEGVDCGVHTAKYFDLEKFGGKDDGDESTMLKFESEEGRMGLALDLFLFEHNRKKADIIQKIEARYPTDYPKD